MALYRYKSPQSAVNAILWTGSNVETFKAWCKEHGIKLLTLIGDDPKQQFACILIDGVSLQPLTLHIPPNHYVVKGYGLAQFVSFDTFHEQFELVY